MEPRFVADAMLGRLAKWLRVMGYDTHYQSIYSREALGSHVRDGRRLLSRHGPTVEQYSHSVFIRSDHVKEQLHEMMDVVSPTSIRSNWFSRCLVCNTPLRDADPEDGQENVPEYVFYRNRKRIRFCPSCGRYFWPGTHRKRMIAQLEAWGFFRNLS